MAFPRGLTEERLKHLAAVHLRRYDRQRVAAESGASGYRIDEIYHLLAVWNSIASKGDSVDWGHYSTQERDEIGDAYYDEDWGDEEEVAS